MGLLDLYVYSLQSPWKQILQDKLEISRSFKMCSLVWRMLLAFFSLQLGGRAKTDRVGVEVTGDERERE